MECCNSQQDDPNIWALVVLHFPSSWSRNLVWIEDKVSEVLVPPLDIDCMVHLWLRGESCLCLSDSLIDGISVGFMWPLSTAQLSPRAAPDKWVFLGRDGIWWALWAYTEVIVGGGGADSLDVALITNCLHFSLNRDELHGVHQWPPVSRFHAANLAAWCALALRGALLMSVGLGRQNSVLWASPLRSLGSWVRADFMLSRRCNRPMFIGSIVRDGLCLHGVAFRGRWEWRVLRSRSQWKWSTRKFHRFQMASEWRKEWLTE